MDSEGKSMELNPINTGDPGKLNVNNEEDVIIGRFRKISSAKSMANGNNQMSDIPAPKAEPEDLDGAIEFRNIPSYVSNKLIDSAGNFIVGSDRPSSGMAGKSSIIRDADKPGRVRDSHSARFQMSDSSAAGSDDERIDSDDPLTTHGTQYDTKYAKSFRRFTREALPRLDNYRMSLYTGGRPTLDELHNASLSAQPNKRDEFDNTVIHKPGTVKFGWIKGVFIRCLLNIWGVMLFLRLTWVVGQAGVGQTVLLILTTSVVTTITALSMSAISTNGVIKGGGTYYMISRSLGPEFGGAIGVIFSLANAVACAMYVVGFCETLMDIIPSSAYMVDKAWDQSIYGCITILVLLGIVIIGMELEMKAQIGLLVILLAAIADFFAGSIIGPKSDEEVVQGFIGYNTTLLLDNMKPAYTMENGKMHNFFTMFAIFFPAATGILAGANISGDLKDPQTSIPKGTLLAIAVTSLSYIMIGVISGWSVVRGATGNVTQLINGTYLDCEHFKCQYGLLNNMQIVKLMSATGPLIYAGCFAATLSSALASLVSAPKVFQALCKDELYPFIKWFAKGYGKGEEPARAYILTFMIAIVFILLGDLNDIAPVISNFFLAAYTLINFSTFHASLARPLGWRPTFRYYNQWLSLLGAILCVGVMVLISWQTALGTFAAVLALYLIVSYRKPEVNWGSTMQAEVYSNALNGVHNLNKVIDHVKNYRPQILVLTGYPSARPVLTDLAYLITKGNSLMICGHIVNGPVNHKTRVALTERAYNFFTKSKMKSFYTLVDDTSMYNGVSALIQGTGLGKLKPNIVLMGMKCDWRSSSKQQLTEYVDVMHKALDVHMALVILAMDGGLDCTSILDDDIRSFLRELQTPDGRNSRTNGLSHRKSIEGLANDSVTPGSQGSSMSDLSIHDEGQVTTDPSALNKKDDDNDKSAGLSSSVMAAVSAVLHKAMSGVHRTSSLIGGGSPLHHFSKKQSGTVDVWWLYDDGGLTLLLPYLLSTRRNWSSCRLRVFTLANKKAQMEFEERNMASLLSKFRIDYSDLQLISDIMKKPQESTLEYFDQLIAKFRTPEIPGEPDSAAITEAELLAATDRTNRQLRVRELLREHSSNSRLVVLTLPMPRRRAVVPPTLYAAWLHAIAFDNNLPPVMFVRGNQSSVLTFYS